MLHLDKKTCLIQPAYHSIDRQGEVEAFDRG